MRAVSFALATVAAVSLTGCYVSTKPLITGANAVFPLPASATYKSSSLDDGDSPSDDSSTGRLVRTGDHYTLHPDPEPGHAPDPKDDMDFRLADIGGGYYAAEADDTEDKQIIMDIVRIDGDTVYQYVLTCEDDDKKLADTHVIDAYEHSEYDNTCTVSSLEQLKRAFRIKLDAGLQPHGKYTFTR